MLHGRGANAEDILSLSNHIEIKDFALFAPDAKNNSWYPQSFLSPPKQNEPWLSSALALIENLITSLNEKNLSKENICFLGFSRAHV